MHYTLKGDKVIACTNYLFIAVLYSYIFPIISMVNTNASYSLVFFDLIFINYYL